MNIYAEKGDKVIVTKDSIKRGYDADKDRAKKYLDVGKVYTVEKLNVYSTHSWVYLLEFPDKVFNSVQFEDFKYEIFYN